MSYTFSISSSLLRTFGKNRDSRHGLKKHSRVSLRREQSLFLFVNLVEMPKLHDFEHSLHGVSCDSQLRRNRLTPDEHSPCSSRVKPMQAIKIVTTLWVPARFMVNCIVSFHKVQTISYLFLRQCLSCVYDNFKNTDVFWNPTCGGQLRVCIAALHSTTVTCEMILTLTVGVLFKWRWKNWFFWQCPHNSERLMFDCAMRHILNVFHLTAWWE